MDTALLGLRVALSLACVLGLIWFAGRRLQGSGTVRKQRTVPLTVLGRQSLGKGAGIVLVEVAGRVLLLGVADQGVRLLTEVTPGAPQAPEPRAAEVREEIDLALVAATDRDVLVAVPADPIDPRSLDVAALPAPEARRRAAEADRVGALHGSALSPDTWRRAVDVVQRRTARR